MFYKQREWQKSFGRKFAITPNLIKFILSLVIALLITFVPDYSNLSNSAQLTMFIIIFAAGLWVTEAIPAFSVALLVVALVILFLGFENFDFQTSNWKLYLKPWSSPLIFLFLGGFIMAEAARKTRLDIWLAKKFFFIIGGKSWHILAGVIIITFILSMFMSNTATTAMMLGVISPIIKGMNKTDPFAKGLLLSIAMAANIGGMGTIIGTPPNAIAIALLEEQAPSFIEWMGYALPPAILVAIIFGYVLFRLYPPQTSYIDISVLKNVHHYDDTTVDFSEIPTIPSWKKILVITIFALTILLWLTSSIHHIPIAVIAFLPIVAYTTFGIIDADDIRSLRWDVILLIIGGLTLGLAVSSSGLAKWLADALPLKGVSIFIIAITFSYMIIIVSNFMSNTSAANVILPIVMAISSATTTSLIAVIAVALSASMAMILPVSTPPNAILYAYGKIASKDFFIIGLLMIFIGPILVLGWFSFII